MQQSSVQIDLPVFTHLQNRRSLVAPPRWETLEVARARNIQECEGALGRIYINIMQMEGFELPER